MIPQLIDFICSISEERISIRLTSKVEGMDFTVKVRTYLRT